MVGKKYNMLTVIEFAKTAKDGHAMWKCECECGNTTIVPGNALKSGNTKSCGCFNKKASTERIVSINTKHGMAHTRLFRVWSGMIARCNGDSKYYGAKGITVCDEWKNDFMSFYKWAIENGYDEKLTRWECSIDRIDGSKGYSPDNCRFTDIKTQNRNRCSTRFIEHNGEVKTLTEWAMQYGRANNRFTGLGDEEIKDILDFYDAYLKKYNLAKLPQTLRNCWGKEHESQDT